MTEFSQGRDIELDHLCIFLEFTLVKVSKISESSIIDKDVYDEILRRYCFIEFLRTSCYREILLDNLYMTVRKCILYFLEEVSPASHEYEIISFPGKYMGKFPTNTRGGSCDENGRHKKVDL